LELNQPSVKVEAEREKANPWRRVNRPKS